MTNVIVYGPHCNHADLCSMDGCDQRGHIDYPCRNQATCTYCHPSKACPMDRTVSVADCAECHVDRSDVDTPEPADGQSVVHPVEHAKDCYPRDACVECGGCSCGAFPSVCVQGCQSIDEHDLEREEYGVDGSCSYGCH